MLADVPEDDRFDVLVVGSGAAGLAAALSAGSADARVAVATRRSMSGADGSGSVRSVAFLGLHPAVVTAIVNGGHNDSLVGLAILAGAIRAHKAWPRPSNEPTYSAKTAATTA